METRIVEVEQFVVKGFSITGSFDEIPQLWDRLNEELAKKEIAVEESFGITLSMQNGKVHYIAGIKSELVKDLSRTEEVLITGGKYIVVKVEGGIPGIRQTFDALLKMDNIQFRKGYGMERYTDFNQSGGYAIEVWMPIE